MDPNIKKIVETFFWLRIWRNVNDPSSKLYTFVQTFIFMVFYVLYFMSLTIGAVISDSLMEGVYLCVTFLSVFLLSLYLLTIAWKQNEVESILRDIAIDESCRHQNVRNKLSTFTTFSNSFKLLAVCGSIIGMVFPVFVGSLPFKIWFPLDWKGNLVSYWLAVAYCLISYTFSIVTAVYLRLFVWFVMLSLSLQYELLGSRFRALGERKRSEANDELKECVIRHRELRETVNQFRNCFAHIFLFQLMIGAFCICCPVLLLSTGNADAFGYIFYSCLITYMVVDMLTITFFGNEITFKSMDLSWCLYESDWINQTRNDRNNIYTCMGFFVHPQKLVVGFLFSLDLQTFTSILNSAYSMFNLLRNL